MVACSIGQSDDYGGISAEINSEIFSGVMPGNSTSEPGWLDEKIQQKEYVEKEKKFTADIGSIVDKLKKAPNEAFILFRLLAS